MWLTVGSPYSPADVGAHAVVIDSPPNGRVSMTLLHVFGVATFWSRVRGPIPLSPPTGRILTSLQWACMSMSKWFCLCHGPICDAAVCQSTHIGYIYRIPLAVWMPVVRLSEWAHESLHTTLISAGSISGLYANSARPTPTGWVGITHMLCSPLAMVSIMHSIPYILFLKEVIDSCLSGGSNVRHVSHIDSEIM
jgi:hypothetical protein